MCIEHASAIDDPSTSDAYPAELLKVWKTQQLEDYDRLKQGWVLSDEMAEEAIQTSFAKPAVVITNARIDLSGKGGIAPGAGGGGGGAIGPGARAGDGGRGGSHTTYEGAYSPPVDEINRLLGQSAISENEADRSELPANPGAGGAGAGAIGPNAVAGDGGGGGNSLSAAIDIAALRAAGLDHIEIEVGEGGKPGYLPGQHSIDGKDTVLKFVTKDGDILEEIRAAGGRGARSAWSKLANGAEEVSIEDFDTGFRITTLMTVNATELRDGLLYTLGGGWSRYFVPTFPCDAVWNFICTVNLTRPLGKTALGFYVALFDPTGREVACVALNISPESKPGNVHFVMPIGATFDKGGTWSLVARSKEFIFSKIDIEVSERGVV